MHSNSVVSSLNLLIRSFYYSPFLIKTTLLIKNRVAFCLVCCYYVIALKLEDGIIIHSSVFFFMCISHEISIDICTSCCCCNPCNSHCLHSFLVLLFYFASVVVSVIITQTIRMRIIHTKKDTCLCKCLLYWVLRIG